MNTKKNLNIKKDDKGFFESYASFSRTLRSWLVAYGIGAPVLFASNEHLIIAVKESKNGLSIIIAFLIGLAIQILAALIYKYAMGYLYFGELDANLKDTKRYKISDWLSEAMWVEFIMDSISICCFIFGTYTTLKAMFNS